MCLFPGIDEATQPLCVAHTRDSQTNMNTFFHSTHTHIRGRKRLELSSHTDERESTPGVVGDHDSPTGRDVLGVGAERASEAYKGPHVLMAKAGDQYTFRTGNLWSVCQRDDLATAKKLVLEDSLELEMRNKAGWTPLHAAANGGAERCLKFLLEQRASIDSRCRAGRTPMIEAARNGHFGVVKHLLNAGAELQATDGSGNTALDCAKGTSLRNFLSERFALLSDDSTSSARRHPSHSGGRREKRAERQPVGASGKAKAKALKEQRRNAAEQKRAALEREELEANGTSDGRSAEPIAVTGDADQGATEDREGHDAIEQPTAPFRAYAAPREVRQPLCLSAAPPEGWNADSSDAIRLLKQRLEGRHTPSEADGVSPPRHVICWVIDARHPLLHLADDVLDAFVSTRCPMIVVLAKADLVDDAHIKLWTENLQPRLPPGTAVVPFSANGRTLSGGGVASRRRALSAPLTGEERACVRVHAERVASACGTELPAPKLELIRGTWRAIDRTRSGGGRQGGRGRRRRQQEEDWTLDVGADDSDRGDGSGVGESGTDTEEEAERDETEQGEADDRAATVVQLEPPRDVAPTTGADAPATGETASSTVIHLMGRANSGKSSLANALLGRHVVGVSQQPGHTQRCQSLEASDVLTVIDSPPLDGPLLDRGGSAWRIVAGTSFAVSEGGARTQPATAVAAVTLAALCGLASSAQVRSPYAAVRELGERIDLLRLYAMQPNELAEAGESDGALSPYGLCCALAAKKGFRQSRSGAPDPHRAGLLMIRDCACGALPLHSSVHAA